jgi:TetR/AcrR family acrAB operon transcriptional repressor
MVRKTKEDALATRAGILDAAERLFQQHGVSRTSLHDIALAAGVTRGAIYWHFEDKADLFNAMMERVILPMEEATAAAERDTTANPLELLRDSVLEVFRRTMEDEQVRRVFEIATQKVEYVDELSAVRERHLRARHDHVASLERALRAAQRQGLIGPAAAVRSAALGLHAIVDGLIQNWILQPGAFDLVRTGRQVIDVHLAGLRVSAPAEATKKDPKD